MTAGGFYWRFVTVKYWLATGGKFWVNTYELKADEEVDITVVPANIIGDALVSYERELHATQVYFDRMVVSTTSADSQPYDPTAGRTITYGAIGARSTSNRVDLNAVYRVRRDVQFGRPGKLAYRGVLQEGDVEADAQGFWAITPGSGLEAEGSVWLAARDNIAGLFNGTLAGAEGWRFVMVTNPGDTLNPLNIPRTVDDFVPAGAGFNRFNHRYFDRS